MRKHGTNSEVVDAFVSGDLGPTHSHSENLFFQDQTLYSYGTHFPLCRKVKDKRNLPKGIKELFAVNGDKYSITTLAHQGLIQGCVRDQDSVTISLSALNRAFSSTFSLQWKEVYFIDIESEIYKDAYDEAILEKDVPVGATVRKKDSVITSYHRPATVLIRFERYRSFRRYIMCGMDEDSYFVCQLPHAVKTVRDAFESLKPKRIKEAEAQGHEVKRQGEWFCVKVADGKEARKWYKEMEMNFCLPHADSGNPHVCTRGMRKRKRYFFSGSLRHEDHRTLRVSKAIAPEIWEAIENTAKRSWSAQGKVD